MTNPLSAVAPARTNRPRLHRSAAAPPEAAPQPPISPFVAFQPQMTMAPYGLPPPYGMPSVNAPQMVTIPQVPHVICIVVISLGLILVHRWSPLESRNSGLSALPELARADFALLKFF